MRNFLLPFGLALILSLLIHFLFFDTFNKSLQNRDLKINSSDKIPNKKSKGYTSIKYVKLKKPQKILKPQKKMVEQPKTISEVQPTPIKKRKVVKKSKTLKNVKTIKIPQKTKEIDLKSLFTMKEEIKKKPTKKQQEIQKEQEKIQKLDPLTQQYIKLYGDKYYSFSKEQKDYLKQNLSLIGKITQRYLQYPAIAGKTGQSGVNIVEFTLHPNGDITDLRISESSYFTSLDKNTIHTIEVAYKDYPKPSEPTKIKIYVKYILY